VRPEKLAVWILLWMEASDDFFMLLLTWNDVISAKEQGVVVECVES
jgi:hypothetical protein